MPRRENRPLISCKSWRVNSWKCTFWNLYARFVRAKTLFIIRTKLKKFKQGETRVNAIKIFCNQSNQEPEKGNRIKIASIRQLFPFFHILILYASQVTNTRDSSQIVSDRKRMTTYFLQKTSKDVWSTASSQQPKNA